MDMTFGSAAILAGGEGRRMGYDKALLTLPDGSSNLLNLAGQLEACFSHVFIVRRRGIYADTPLPGQYPVVYDAFDAPGPLSGLHAALCEARSEYVFVVACDAGDVDPAYISLLQQEVTRLEPPAVLPRVGEFVQPFWAFYRTDLAQDIAYAVAEGQQSPFRFIRQYEPLIISESQWRAAGVEESMFTNRNH